MVGGWAPLVVLARRLPPGLLRDLAAAWPGEPRLLERLVGRAGPAAG
jgi:hypothetical protein